MKKTSFSKGEKRMFFFFGAFVVIVLAVAWWVQYVNADPVVTIPPSPAMPNPNALDFYLKAADSFVSCPVQTPERTETFSYEYLYDHGFYKGIVHGKEDWKPTLGQLQQLQRLNLPAFNIMREGFKYQCNGARCYDNYNNFNSHNNFEVANKINNLSRNLEWIEQILFMSGNWNEAMYDAIDAIYIGEDQARCSSLSGEMIRNVMESKGRPLIWPYIDHLNAIEARADTQRMEKILSHHVSISQVLQEQKRETLS